VLSRGRLAAAQHGGDLRVGLAQRVVQDQRDPLGGGQALEEHQGGQSDVLPADDGGKRPLVVGGGDQRLGQPRADVGLPLGRRRGQQVEADPPDDRREPGARVAHLRPVRGPAQPGLLHGVLGVGHAAGDPVPDTQEVRPQLLEVHPAIGPRRAPP
jgi:hypothetical protein